jgi:hypothetical protein
MKPTRSLLILSLVLNAALAAGVGYFLRPGSPPVAAAVAPGAGLVPPVVSTADGTSAPPAVTMITNQFQWRALEATNYGVFVANLRAVGCPEKTIRDLVLADLRATLLARQRAETRAVPFWTGGQARARWVRENQEREARLAAEFAALAKRLLGVDWHPDDEDMNEFTDQAITRFLSGPLPEETFQRLCGVLKKFERMKSQLEEERSGIELPEDRAVGLQLRAQLQSELTALLTPGQVEEFLARVAGVPDSNAGFERDALEISPAEFRALCVASLRHFDPLQDMLDLEDPPEEEQAQAQTNFFAEVRVLLGEARFADFERAQDDQFLSLYRTVHEEVGRTEIVKAYEVSQLARAEAARLGEDVALDADVRQQRLAQLAALTEAELRRVLGEKAFQRCRAAKLGLLSEDK